MMELRFYGVRGSHNAPDAALMRYGGCTTCVAVMKKNSEGLLVPLIIDAGNGLIKVGHYLAEAIKAGTGAGNITLLLTHLHQDHTQGFCFFAPAFMDEVRLHIIGMKKTETALRGSMSPPLFPVGYDSLPAQKVCTEVDRDTVFYIGQDGAPVFHPEANPLFEIRVFRAGPELHPLEGALYYRISDCDESGSSVVCLWDIEAEEEALAKSESAGKSVIDFAKGATVLIHDTTYSDDEYNSREIPVHGFGHSSYGMALKLAEAAGAKNLAAFHYNPQHSDDFLDRLSAQNLIMAKEGLALRLEKGSVSGITEFKQGFVKNRA
jgi:ribonuclease BN (tRNA processing enzyme)